MSDKENKEKAKQVLGFNVKKLVDVMNELDEVLSKHKLTAAESIITASLWKETQSFRTQCAATKAETKDALNKVLGGETNASLKYVH